MNTKSLFFCLCMSMAGSAAAFDNFPVENSQQLCFAKAMVGMDSVINAGLGVPPEHALELVMPNGDIHVLNDKKSVDMLNTILNAYFWKESPHSYAVNVFYRCAVNYGKTHAQPLTAANR